jgi:hypothetical protein
MRFVPIMLSLLVLTAAAAPADANGHRQRGAHRGDGPAVEQHHNDRDEVRHRRHRDPYAAPRHHRRHRQALRGWYWDQQQGFQWNRGHGGGHHIARRLNPNVVLNRLARQHWRSFGRLSLHDGRYKIRVRDRRHRPWMLVIDAYSGHVLRRRPLF